MADSAERIAEIKRKTEEKRKKLVSPRVDEAELHLRALCPQAGRAPRNF